MTQFNNIAALLNSTAEAAKRAHLNHADVGAVLEEIRRRATGDCFELWDAIDGEIGKAGAGVLQSLLIELRKQFQEQLIASMTDEIAAAFRRSPEAGWKEWTRFQAESLCRLRVSVTKRVAEQVFPFPEDKKKQVEEFKAAAPKYSRRLWDKVVGVVGALAEMEFVEPVVRARLRVILAETLDSDAEVKKQLDAAELLAPEDGRVQTGLGEYWMRQKDLEKAKSCFERAIRGSPLIANGYCGLGEYFERREKLVEAEEWYKKALTYAAGDSQGYGKLLELYGRPELFPQRQQAIGDLAERSAVVTPEEAFQSYLDVVALYRRNKQFETAKQWYEKAEAECYAALRADKEYASPLSGLETLAEDYLLYKDPEHALRIYDATLKIVGDSYRANYHNRFANVRYDQGDYVVAGQHYRKAIEAGPEEPIFHRNLAAACRELKDYDKAEGELSTALALDHNEAAYKEQLALVANARGNDYYSASDYEKAIQKYQQAVDLEASDAVMHSNLAGAWENLKEPGRHLEAIENAIREYEAAQELNPDGGYQYNVQRLKRKKAFGECYGEESLDWTHLVTPIAVEVASNLVPYVQGTQGGLASELSGHIDEMRKRIQDRFGVQIPGVRFRGNDSSMTDGTYLILIMELPLVVGSISLNKKFHPGPPARLEALGISGEEALNPETGENGLWITEKDAGIAESKQLTMWNPLKYLVRHLESVVRRNLVEFVGHQELAEIFNEEIGGEPLALERLTALAAVARGLVAEEVPIRPFGSIYETFNDLYPKHPLREIVERIRQLPEVRNKLWESGRFEDVLGFGPHLRAALRESIYENHSHPVLAMEPQSCQNVLTAVREALRNRRNPALTVNDPMLRPFVRSLTEIEFPQVPVFKREELPIQVATALAGEVEVEKGTVIVDQNFNRLWPKEKPAHASATRAKETLASLPKSTFPDESPKIILYVSGPLYSEHARSIAAALDQAELIPKFYTMREGLFYELGLVVPEVQVERDSSLPEDRSRYRLNDALLAEFEGLKPDEYMVNETVSRLKLLSIEAREAVNPVTQSAAAIVQGRTNNDACQRAGLFTWNASDYLVLKLSEEVRKHAATFQTVSVTQFILDNMQPLFPRLVDAILARFTVEQVNSVLEELLNEEISIRDLRGIFESMLSVNGTLDIDLANFIVVFPHVDNFCPVIGSRPIDQLTMQEYADVVRMSLKRYISHKYTRGSSTLPVYLVDQNIQARLSNTTAEPVTEEENDLLLKIFSEQTQRSATGQNPVLLTSFESRRPLRQLLEQKFPSLAVLSYQELLPDMNIQPLARISWT